MRPRTAVIPAAGLGTRFLPATKVVPKELLPIVDTPALHLIVDEAVGAGIDHVVVITSRKKPAIQAWFEPAPEIIAKLRSSGRDEVADRLERIGQGVRISFAFQEEALGLGHAIGCARDAVGGEPFAVLLPDELMSGPQLLAQMIDVCERTDGSVVGVKEVEPAEVVGYGVIDPIGELDDTGVVEVRTLVEKPKVDEAPSRLILIGRYVLTNDIFDEIDALVPGAGGELQLTDALRAQATHRPFHAVNCNVVRHDTGTPLGWLAAVLDVALADPRIGPDLGTWLRARLDA